MMEDIDKLYAETRSIVTDKKKIAKLKNEDVLSYDPAAFIKNYKNNMTEKQIRFFKGQSEYRSLFGRTRKFRKSDTDLDFDSIWGSSLRLTLA